MFCNLKFWKQESKCQIAFECLPTDLFQTLYDDRHHLSIIDRLSDLQGDNVARKPELLQSFRHEILRKVTFGFVKLKLV